MKEIFNQEIFMLPIKDWCVICGLVLYFTILLMKNKLPSVSGIKELIEVVNSRGGNIIILAGMAIFFFLRTYAAMMNMINMVAAGTLKPDNVFANAIVQFLTTSAFGGTMGALLVMMTGGSRSAEPTQPVTTSNIATSQLPGAPPV